MKRKIISVVLAAVLASAVVAGAAARSSTLSLFISSSFYSTYNATLSVTATASFRDPECGSSSTCDRNVEAEFTLRQGTSSYGRISARVHAETGQYSSSLRAKLGVPCKLIPKGTSRSYLLTVTAVAPNAEERTTSRVVRIYSCLR